MFGNFSSPARRSTSRGFTLIELLIVVAIIGILAAIALPSYRAYYIRGALTDAATGLTMMRSEMEAYYQNFRTYQASGGATPPCANGRPVGKFTITCSNLSASTYLLTAGSSDNLLSGFEFTIDQAGLQKTSKAPNGWNSCLSRWVMVKGETC